MGRRREFCAWLDGGSDFNDKFELLLNGVNYAKLSDGKTVTINNIAPDPYCFEAGNEVKCHPDYIDNPQQKYFGYKGYTKIERFKASTRKGDNTLQVHRCMYRHMIDMCINMHTGMGMDMCSDTGMHINLRIDTLI